MAKKVKKAVPMTPTSTGEGPVWYKSYDIRWLKSVRNEHPDAGLVSEYEKKYGEIA